MAIKKYKPTTPGHRGMTVTDYSVLSKVAPERSLLEPNKKHAGRNNTGKITVRHHGGGNRVKYRVIDFKRNKFDVPATVKTLEYDPNRSAFIALVEYEDGAKSYILAPDGLKVGDTIMAGPNADIKPGNALPFENIPVGTMIHNIELYPGKGGQLVRSAGVMAQLMAKENGYALVRLPSGEMRNVRLNCIATIGVVSNLDHENVNLGKAGRKRHMGVRPGSRGSVMNPCDHPHGGGEGRAPVGHSSPRTPWGKPMLCARWPGRAGCRCCPACTRPWRKARSSSTTPGRTNYRPPPRCCHFTPRTLCPQVCAPQATGPTDRVRC